MAGTDVSSNNTVTVVAGKGSLLDRKDVDDDDNKDDDGSTTTVAIPPLTSNPGCSDWGWTKVARASRGGSHVCELVVPP